MNWMNEAFIQYDRRDHIEMLLSSRLFDATEMPKRNGRELKHTFSLKIFQIIGNRMRNRGFLWQFDLFIYIARAPFNPIVHAMS